MLGGHVQKRQVSDETHNDDTMRDVSVSGKSIDDIELERMGTDSYITLHITTHFQPFDVWVWV